MADADAELLARFAAGDRKALETLYWRYAERVWRFGRHFGGSPEAASEIVQETFLRVARSAKTFGGRSEFSTWLYAVTRSAAIDWAAKAKRRPAAAEDEVLSQMPAVTTEPHEHLAVEENCTAVRAAVARLPENERLAIVMCALQDMPIRQAAAVLEWGESRLKVTLFRARRRLREMLAPHVGRGT